VKAQASGSEDKFAGLLSLIRSLESNIDYNHREFRELAAEVSDIRSQLRSRVVELERRVRELERRGR
jgi:hypothetical protein